ncbi:MAG TPA: DUF932 domain-containing protein [Solirubrobacteraceae bacterium]|nr:DUF932 domain-containing protein [Solirubrobacteraceae bacterium]
MPSIAAMIRAATGGCRAARRSPAFFATVRQDTREVLGIVGERYRIVQNHEAFDFIDQLLGSSIHFETAGSLHGGRRVWVLATLPDHVEVGGDAVRPYVLLMNSHDGSTAVIAATTPIRVVCQNTLNWGLLDARQKFSIRHTEAVTQRVHEARRVLDLSVSYYKQFKRFGDQLASERCTERQLRAVLDELYPSGTSDSVSGRTRKSRQQTKDRIAELFICGDTQGNAPGSKWAAVNAIVEYGDWLRPLRSSGQRFARALDDGPEKTARCSSSQPHERVWPGGHQTSAGPAAIDRWTPPAYSPTMKGQGAGPRGRFLPRSVLQWLPELTTRSAS